MPSNCEVNEIVRKHTRLVYDEHCTTVITCVVERLLFPRSCDLFVSRKFQLTLAVGVLIGRCLIGIHAGVPKLFSDELAKLCLEVGEANVPLFLE